MVLPESSNMPMTSLLKCEMGSFILALLLFTCREMEMLEIPKLHQKNWNSGGKTGSPTPPTNPKSD